MGISAKSLDKISVNNQVKIVKINPKSKVRRRLMDMGIISGVTVCVEGKAPLGDPIQIRIRGYNLTLRKSEAKDILVE